MIIIESQLASTPEAVWARVSTMAGVNRELMPIVRMTSPPSFDQLDADHIVLGTVLFQSWLLLFGFMPYDRHALRLVGLKPGRGFHEESTSWTQKRWMHIRTVSAIPNGTLVQDEVDFEPRIPFLKPLFVPVIRAVFRHRHRVLRRDFGTV